MPAIGLAGAGLHSAVPHQHPWETEAQAADAHTGHPAPAAHPGGHAAFRGGAVDHVANGFDPHEVPVSYTHLTLPTTPYV